MHLRDVLDTNISFIHWFAEFLVEGLTNEQLHWQPSPNSHHIAFALWHTIRTEDDFIHGFLQEKPTVWIQGGWAERLGLLPPPGQGIGWTAGTGWTTEHVAQVRIQDLGAFLDYMRAVDAAVLEYVRSLDEAKASEKIALPFFEETYPMLKEMSRGELLAFFCIGHNGEHLGEIQYLRGLQGLKGAPL
jgi:uncharacterized damage-inducible protein DinB